MTGFQELLKPVTETVADNEIDHSLASRLNSLFPHDGDYFREIEAACQKAIGEGWMCSQGGEGRRFGRVIEPSPETANLSVDVVDLDNIAGPHHEHPRGEICMVMPQDKGATFDGNGAGWCVYPPGSAHYPTVRDGRALVLYLLPGGEIRFTGK